MCVCAQDFRRFVFESFIRSLYDFRNVSAVHDVEWRLGERPFKACAVRAHKAIWATIVVQEMPRALVHCASRVGLCAEPTFPPPWSLLPLCVQEPCDDPYDVNLFRMLVGVVFFLPLATVVNGVGIFLILSLKLIPVTVRAMYHVSPVLARQSSWLLASVWVRAWCCLHLRVAALWCRIPGCQYCCSSLPSLCLTCARVLPCPLCFLQPCL